MAPGDRPIEIVDGGKVRKETVGINVPFASFARIAIEATIVRAAGSMAAGAVEETCPRRASARGSGSGYWSTILESFLCFIAFR